MYNVVTIIIIKKLIKLINNKMTILTIKRSIMQLTNVYGI